MPDRIVVLGGSGDAYLICALADAYNQQHNQKPVIVLRSRLAAVAELFPEVEYEVNDSVVDHAEADKRFQQNYPNDVRGVGGLFYCHPCFERTPFRVDALTAHPTASQADMYRMLLQLSTEAPLSLPSVPSLPVRYNTVVVIKESTSWPNTQPDFWPGLVEQLSLMGREVLCNRPEWTLRDLLRECAGAEWVIGPQCGVMSILATGRFACRKTLCTPSVDDNCRPDFWARQTYPYGYLTKFAGEDYDAEEFKLTDANHDEVIRSILTGVNFNRRWEHNPQPVVSVSVPLSVGDFLDRLAVLTVKKMKLPPLQAAGVEREYLRYQEQLRVLHLDESALILFRRLVALHSETFDLLDFVVPAALEPCAEASAHAVQAIKLNKRRIELKQQIDRLCHAPYTEVKSYYGD